MLKKSRNGDTLGPVELIVQGDFFNWASPEFAKYWPVSNRFQKSPRLAPRMIEKKSKSA